ncbi:MAG: hypothetical protein JSU04_20240 [Bdellovibrionales bacterium]|nr:hypothetical protein [Bdellovibrionales bacterium]
MSEVISEEKATKKATAPKKKNVLKKLDPDSAKALQVLKDKANKKVFGRKVRDSEILALGLSLITTDHIQQLQNQTLSEKDRLHIAHEEYQRANGKISLDQFIGKLLAGEFRAQHKEIKN